MSAELMRDTCARCSAIYAPSRTSLECPLCGLHAGADRSDGTSTPWADPSNRVVLLVAGFTLANILLFALMALAISRASG